MSLSHQSVPFVTLLFTSLTWTRLITYGSFLILTCFAVDIGTQPRYPKHIPRMGYQGSGWWSKVRNSFTYFTKHRSWIQQGYYKYGKQDVAFIAPASIARPDDVILPRSQIAWMMDQPDNVLSADKAHGKILHSSYNFLGHNLERDAFGSRAMHKYLARHLPALIPAIEDEANRAVQDVLGSDTENWKSVNIWQLWLSIVPRITNRLLIGEPVCRNETFLGSMVAFVDDVVRNSFLLNMFPLVVHPLVGRLLALPNWIHWRKADSFISDLIKQRLHDMTQKQLGDPTYADWTPPEDFITWDIRLAFTEQNRFELDPNIVSKRILPIEFAAIHTTALTGQSWMLDLLTTPPEAKVLDTLRDELLAQKPLPSKSIVGDSSSYSGSWNKSALISLVRVDSSIRESQRLSNFAATLVERQVVSPDGLYNPTLGWVIPQGAFVTVNLEGTHHDDDLYPEARSYDPWRYSRPREAWEDEKKKREAERGANGKKSDDEVKEEARTRGLGMVTTSDAHLAFGHGRHACPGRFFVAHELKLIMAAILLNYDLKMIDHRPQPQWFGGTIIPPLDACVEIRRRKDAL
ncbi:cytochrome P450 [Mariannaea sp. PMI_226]|nr:cytochrome P450 [Mariannaea sp. PMI_226]